MQPNPKTVLLVASSAELKAALPTLGVKVVEAETADGAYEQVVQSPKNFQGVLIEMQTTGVERALQLSEQLRRLKGERFAIILASSNNLLDEGADATRFGADFYLVLPDVHGRLLGSLRIVELVPSVSEDEVTIEAKIRAGEPV